MPLAPESVDLPGPLEDVVRLGRNLTGLPMVNGTNHGVEMDYEASIGRLTAMVEAARETVHVEIYIMARDETTEGFFRALEDAVRRGVKVRLLLDHIGSMKYPHFRKFLKSMTLAGIDWYLMMPFLPLKGRVRRPDLRNHRKLMIVDGKIAWMGSQNLIESTYGNKKNKRIGRHWNDVSVVLSGEIISALESVFMVDWYTESGEVLPIHAYRDDPELDGVDEDGNIGFDEIARLATVLPVSHEEAPEVGGEHNALQLIPSGPGFRTDPNLRVFTALMYMAREKLAIVSPYFVPDESLLAAITSAGQRGVVVDLYVSEQADQFMVDHAQSSYYQALMESGVRIHLLPKPQVLHTKGFVVDDVCAVVGSSNMDMRSFGLDYEISLLAYGGDLITQMQDTIAVYEERSTVLAADTWPKRSPVRRYLESVFRLTSALQ
jgi:cardiolipin synthase